MVWSRSAGGSWRPPSEVLADLEVGQIGVVLGPGWLLGGRLAINVEHAVTLAAAHVPRAIEEPEHLSAVLTLEAAFESVSVMWSLDLLIALVGAGQLASDEAIAIGADLHRISPRHITRDIPDMLERQITLARTTR